MTHSLALAATIHADRLAAADRHRLIRDLQPEAQAPRLRRLGLRLAALGHRWDTPTPLRRNSGPVLPSPATSA